MNRQSEHIVLAVILLLLPLLPLHSQETATWEQLWSEIQAGEDGDEEMQADVYERLAQLARSPLNLNSATREELEQLPFLSELQVMDIQEYCRRYGPVRSMRELKMIPSLEYRQLELLPFFVFAGPSPVGRDSTTTSTGVGRWLHYVTPRSEITFTGRLPFEDRKGDQNGYLGYKYRHSFRCEVSSGERLRAGIIGSQDSGEPFFAHGNSWGYDNYSYYVQVGRLGFIDKAMVGKYRLSAGMGLVLGGSFTMGKLASLQTLGREPTTLRPHTSRSEADYFRGAAVTLGLLRRSTAADAPLKLTLFASHRPMDATLADDGTATTLSTAGYHRTEAEMARKGNIHLTAFGGRVAFASRGWRVGLNVVTTSLDRELCPSSVLYHRYSPAGTRFFNTSLDYSYTRPHLTIGGETAISRNGAVATVNRVGWQPTGSLSLMALYRYYGYRYAGLYSHSFGDNSTAQNESGLFVGATWKPLRHLTLMAYTDFAYFPWARYLVSQSSHAVDFLLQAEYRLSRWQLLGRGRVRLRERDDEAKTALTANNEYRGRLSATYTTQTGWSARTQLDGVRTFYLNENVGWMLSEMLSWQNRSWMLSATAAYFHTDGYASRLYFYERQLAHEYYQPSYFGEGMRLGIIARKDFGRRLRLTARLGCTRYFDRSTIGTGLQQIDAPHQTDLDLQLRWLLPFSRS